MFQAAGFQAVVDQRSMTVVHSSSQRSRCASMSAGETSAGSLGHDGIIGEDLRQFRGRIDREHEHLQWHILLKRDLEQEIDEFSGEFGMFRPFQDAGKFDLPEGGTVVDHGGGRGLGKRCRTVSGRPPRGLRRS